MSAAKKTKRRSGIGHNRPPKDLRGRKAAPRLLPSMPDKRLRRTKAEINAIKAGIIAVLEADNPMTVRARYSTSSWSGT